MRRKKPKLESEGSGSSVGMDTQGSRGRKSLTWASDKALCAAQDHPTPWAPLQAGCHYLQMDLLDSLFNYFVPIRKTWCLKSLKFLRLRISLFLCIDCYKYTVLIVTLSVLTVRNTPNRLLEILAVLTVIIFIDC